MRRIVFIPPGEQIAGYTVMAAAGAGGSGILYRVRDVSGGIFILKQIPAERTEELASIEQYRKLPPHPGLTVIHGAGKLPDGGFYYLMDAADNLHQEPEYLPDTLWNRLAERGPMKTPEILSLAERLAEAVQHLHRNGLTHSDVKPENVIFCSGQPELADFGSLTPCSETGRSRGTPGFIPEEELFSAVRPSFPGKNDLYALGMTLYCAWSGRSPEEFPALPEVTDKAGMTTVRKLCLRACDPSPACRFHSADEFLLAIRRARKKLQPKSRKRFLMLLLLLPAILAAVFLRLPGTGLTEAQIQAIRSAESTARMAEERELLQKHLLLQEAMTPEERTGSRIAENIRTLKELQQFSALCRRWRSDPDSASLKKELLTQLKTCPKGFHSVPRGVRGMEQFVRRMQTLSPEENAWGDRLAGPEKRKRFTELRTRLKTTSDPAELIRLRKEIRVLLEN